MDIEIKDIEKLLKEFFSDEKNQDFKKREAVKKITDKTFKSNYKGSTKENVPYEIGFAAYRYILENGGSSKEALEYAVMIHDKSVEWLDNVKHNPYYHSKKVVMEHDNHPQQKVMMDNSTMDKSALKSSTTVSQQMNKLARYKRVSDQLEELKNRNDNLEAGAVLDRVEIESLKEYTGMEGMSKKEQAYLMYQKGSTQKYISDLLGVHERTVKRWWKDFKNKQGT